MRLIVEHGGPVSGALLDPACSIFRAPGLRGVIGYRKGLGCAVGLGDPVAPADQRAALGGAFRAWCRQNGMKTAYAAASEAFAREAEGMGYASLQVCEEQILDPRRDPTQGSKGREVRKKVMHAKRDGVVVEEHHPDFSAASYWREEAMLKVAADWLAARKGPQIFLAHIDLFDVREGRRWICARVGDQVVGVLSMLELRARGGYLLEHHLVSPEAPQGTSELLIVGALERLGAEGVQAVTFGPAPASGLGHVANLGAFSERAARKVFDACVKTFHFDARARYRQKFQLTRTAPSFVLLDPPRFGVLQAMGLLRAFNVSLA
ncbi:MAG TPA: DUF2156 domain-containing protein [Polyangiaceae bacterium]|nr:DUF2156 domain-containing protein [Polyangiaceae bacterium]